MMGTYFSRKRTEEEIIYGDEVNFDHFQVIRSIGKGSFGKVCIVRKKDTKILFAMKYMNKVQCIERDALKNVLREVKIMKSLEHPLLVNLWFSFQDEEDLFMVTDLFLGGDLRFHIHNNVNFSEESVKLLVCEIALALQYLQSKHIVHRDVKPDNILLDSKGHAHLTDFNIATILCGGRLASAMTGTKPYIAPEVFDCTLALSIGYSYPVDWWALGIVAYEMLRGCRPFDIHSHTPFQHAKCIFNKEPEIPEQWCPEIVDLMKKLICVNPDKRISTIDDLKKLKCLSSFDIELVYTLKYIPSFKPPDDHLNYDPTFELEEMIVETKPLHKKKKRLAKRRSMREAQTPVDVECNAPLAFSTTISEFTIYNRHHELEKREREQKELEWEIELISKMNASEPLGPVPKKNTILSKKAYQKLVNNLEKPSNLKCSAKLKKLKSCDFPRNKECAPIVRNLSEEMLNSKDNVTANIETESQLPLAIDESTTAINKGLNCDTVNELLQNLDFIDKSPSPVERNKHE